MISADRTIPRTDLALPRFLALILFSLAAIIGLPAALASLGPLAAGDWHALAILAVACLIAGMLVWLGMVLWAGRPIPRWFLCAFGLFMVSVPVVGALADGTWMDVLVVLSMMVPVALQFRSTLRGYPGKPARPEGHDDFADGIRGRVDPFGNLD